ncbi:hypothetical protein [Neolewinella litorea]|uniref:Uncharacterized protein n=1 Tax=Neolewinella litorea TaxID=2562452 RepID=A0A4S4NN28_9BACT|nr:hypothetical protein [Neolewinella litorea]THH41369.1 hypothetical protein E4021_01870 [Neolewinella litorea]
MALLGLTACADDPPPAAVQTPGETPADVRTTNSVAGLDWSRKRYDRTLEMERNGQLRCDTVVYDCPDDAAAGRFIFCYAGGDLVRAAHEATLGDHASVSESYYYDGDDMYVAKLASGAWHFASPADGQTETPGEPATIDEVHEEMRYYSNGDLVDRRFKDYVIDARTPGPPPENIPDRDTGEGVDNTLGPDAVRAVQRSNTYACP